MSFGIGLGAFVDGFSKGVAARQQLDAQREKRQNKAALAKIDTDAQAAFDEKVAAGEEQPDAYDDFWKTYALPRKKAELIRQGDYEGAKKLEEWGNSEAALKGGRLFSSAMLKAQTGDAAGALRDAIKAGQVKGYIDHGYELLGQEDIKDEAGNTVGFRLKVKMPDGKEVDQDIAVGDVPRVVATFANPEAAWETQRAAADEKRKRAEGLEDYEAKKKIDQRYKSGDDEEAYRKVAADLAKNDLDWSSRSPEEQDRMIRDRLDAAKKYASQNRAADSAPGLGAPEPAQAPDERVIVDEGTGDVVPTPSRSSPPAPQPVDPEQVSSIGLGQETPAAAPTPTPRPAKQPSRRQMTKQDHIADAADYMRRGGNPETIAMRLMNAGIAEKDWPEPVRSAIMKRRQTEGPIGLGR